MASVLRKPSNEGQFKSPGLSTPRGALQLLDEPLSNLDAALRGQLRRELRRLHERLGTTTVLVTHDQEEAASLADRIAVIHNGRIVQTGAAVEVLERPQTRFVAEFVSFDSFIAGRVVERRGVGAFVMVSGGQAIELRSDAQDGTAGDDVVAAARGDALALHRRDAPISRDPILRGTVRHVGRPRRVVECGMATGASVLLVRADGHQEGDSIPGQRSWWRSRLIVRRPHS